MKLTANLQLKTTPDQFHALLDTLRIANDACNYISQIAWNSKVFGQWKLHRLVYYDVKEKFGLSAQIVIHCISKVVDAYKKDKKTIRVFRMHGSITYDDRILKYHPGEVSIWTIDGRKFIPYVLGERQQIALENRKGESDLIYCKGKFYLNFVYEVEEPAPDDPNGFLGIDLGIVNIASDSTGEQFAGNHLNSLRKRHSKLRKKLQSKGTKSAKRLLTKRRKKEKLFARDINHIISKKIVSKAKALGLGIALEDLKGIRNRVTVKKSQRRQHNSWSFYQLQQFIVYKAILAGIAVKFVEAAYTSQTCPICGCVDKHNRPDQSTFSCIKCSFAGNADTVAARNISCRASVNMPNAVRNEAKALEVRNYGRA